MSERVKEQLSGERLNGLLFYPLEWDEPVKAQANFWEVGSSVIMPPCKLPLVNADGSILYEENGYRPVELMFSVDEVRALGAFDVAWCREEIGYLNKPNWGRHALVVSQRFRKVMQKLGLDNLIIFYPVRLKA